MLAVFFGLLNCLTAFASSLPTGNGYGLAVVSEAGAVTALLSRPYTRAARPKIADGLSDSDPVELTTNFLANAHWVAGGRILSGATRYLRESHVAYTYAGNYSLGAFEPLGLSRSALVLTAAGDGPAPRLSVKWRAPLSRKTAIGSATLYEFKGLADLLLVAPLDGGRSPAEDSTCRHCLAPGRGWALLPLSERAGAESALAELARWQANAPIGSLSGREADLMDVFRKPSEIRFRSEREKRLARQSETLLRMAQIREPSASGQRGLGLVNASLPDGEFAVPFARDMSYSLAALARTHHGEEARLGVLAYFNARPMGVNLSRVRDQPYQISTTRYFGSGEEEADYSGQKMANLELDNWGLALWALGVVNEHSPVAGWLESPTYRGPLYEAARDFVVKPLLANLDPLPQGGLIVARDTSVWEQNDEEPRHYAASTLAALSGLKRFLGIAEARGDSELAEVLRWKLPLLERGFPDAFVWKGQLLGAAAGEASAVTGDDGEPFPGRNDIDGSLLEAVNQGVLTDRPITLDLLARVESSLAAPSGGYRRTNGPSGYERQEFVFTAFNLARAYLRVDLPGRAQEIVERIEKLAEKDHRLIPELYVAEPGEEFPGRVGTPAGAIPMIGYGAGAFLLYLEERDHGF